MVVPCPRLCILKDSIEEVNKVSMVNVNRRLGKKRFSFQLLSVELIIININSYHNSYSYVSNKQNTVHSFYI